MIKATFVGITREKEYPKEIDTSMFDEVIIKTECPSIYERYIQAMKARNEIVYVQDDDCIVDVEQLFKAYNGQLTNSMTEHHVNWYRERAPGITLVGWGCFFPKKILTSLSRYVDKYGVDAHLLREADRIFTYLNQPHNTLIMAHKDFSRQDSGRMWNESAHWESMAQALEKLRLI